MGARKLIEQAIETELQALLPQLPNNKPSMVMLLSYAMVTCRNESSKQT